MAYQLYGCPTLFRDEETHNVYWKSHCLYFKNPNYAFYANLTCAKSFLEVFVHYEMEIGRFLKADPNQFVFPIHRFNGTLFYLYIFLQHQAAQRGKKNEFNFQGRYPCLHCSDSKYAICHDEDFCCSTGRPVILFK